MEPLNKRERKLAVWQFALIYGASLIVPFLAAAFIFSVPTDALESENARLRTALAEQVKLNAQLETMVKRLDMLEDDDKAYLNTTNELEKGKLKSSIEEHENAIKQAVYALKQDTTQFTQDSIRRFARNALTLVDASLNYRNTMAYLRDLLEENGVNTEAMDKLNAQITAKNAELAAKEDKISMLQLMLVQKPAPAGGGGGSGSKPTDCSLYISRLQKADDEISSLKASLKAAGGSTNTVSESVVRDKVAGEFIEVLIRKGDDPKKAPCARKPMYELAIETLNKSQKPDAASKVGQLQEKIKKISD